MVHNEIRGSVSGPTVQAGVHIGDNYFHQPTSVLMNAFEVPALAATDIEWLASTVTEAEVNWTPPFGRGRRPLLIAGGVWLTVWLMGLIGIVVAGGDREFVGSFAFGLLPPLTFVLLIWLIPRRFKKTRICLLGLSFYLAVVYVAFPVAALPWPDAIVFLPLAAGFLLVPLASRLKRFRMQEKLFTPEFCRFNVFGAPAPAHIHVADGYQPLDYGKRMFAVRLTDHLFGSYVVGVSGARIFHHVASPSSEHAVVDHAVLCGRRLVLVDSMIWPAGRYGVDASGYILHDGYPFPEGALVLGNVVRQYQNLLAEVEVRGVVILWTKRGEKVVGNGWHPGVEVAVLTAESFVKQVGSWLFENPTTVDRQVLVTVRDLVRS